MAAPLMALAVLHAALAEQVAPVGEQLLLDQVLDRARGDTGRAGLLIGAEFLTQPSHGAIEVMQRQATIPPRDVIIDRPLLAGAIPAGDHDPVQHAGEHRAFDRELEAARCEQLSIGSRAGWLVVGTDGNTICGVDSADVLF